MKLLVKTSLYYLVLSIPVLLIAGMVSYYMITSEVRDSSNELLLKRKTEIEKLLAQEDTVSLNMIIQSGEAIISPFKGNLNPKNVFSDTLIYDQNEKESAANRMLTAEIQTSYGNYRVKVWRSTLEFAELFQGILTASFIILGFLFAIFFSINLWVSHKQWKPFYHILSALQNFSPGQGTKPELASSSIKEFSDLNKSVSSMMDKMIADFKSQKQFTENAAHEMQTPLAVIKSKIDLLIQSDKLGKDETDLILSIEDATSKLARLNKALLLLTRIGNRQFVAEADVSLNKTVGDSLTLLDEYIQEKKITVSKHFAEDIKVTINPDLCFVMVNNLLQNAVRHNTLNGHIEIRLDRGRLMISNTGQSFPLDQTKLFNRFQKNSLLAESLGLGLAIAKEIADTSNISLKYSYSQDMHNFVLSLV